ncbi:MAG: bile acid:sodium symporter [Proteobacteria bacterium]|uniref:Bile acid:sodium symporter n=1 Tax=Candidatus Avisuccinivibrio stercorigallinarum TaxID=2840704 RepID=A0A9D9DC61_9GAMM|nr:bile acid:sodium symporter [Candidatus Avisuccinivibrio stercorigallinarum]
MQHYQVVRYLRVNALPVAIGTGIVLYFAFHYLRFLDPLRPAGHWWVDTGVQFLIFVMLFIAFCKIDPHQMRPRRWHWFLVLIQAGGSLALALYLLYSGQTNNAIIDGLIACLICPTAAAASVITGKLGGNESSLTTYTLISNTTAAVAIPLIFPLLQSNGQGLANFSHDFYAVSVRIFPMLVLPLICAFALRYLCRPVHQFIATKSKDLGFYLWAVTLVSVSAKSMSNIVNSGESALTLWILAGVGLFACLLQFALGKLIGNFEGQRISAGQGLGQKNMAFGIWACYTYLSPAAAIAPGCYVLWQNIVNSWQLWYKDHFDAKRAAKGLPVYHE